MAGSIELYNFVLNQLGTPALYSDTIGNRPAAGYEGRLFISTDTNTIYRDTGLTWVAISGGGGGGGNTIYSASDAIVSNRVVTVAPFTLTFAGPSSKNSLVISTGGRVLINTATDTGTYELDINGQARIQSTATIASQTAATSHIIGNTDLNAIAWTGANFAISSAIPSGSTIIARTGTYSTLTGTGNTIIGSNAGLTLTTGANNTLIGTNMGRGLTTGSANVLIGNTGTTNLSDISDAIHITTGYEDASAFNFGTYHAFIGGSSSGNTTRAIRQYYFGLAPFSANAASVPITFNAPSGSGTNISGANYNLSAGRGTGNANGGSLILQTSTPTTSGTSLQTLTNRLTAAGNGAFIGIHQNAINTYNLAITGNTQINSGYLDNNVTFTSVGVNGSYAAYHLANTTLQSSGSSTSGRAYTSLNISNTFTLNNFTVTDGSFVNGAHIQNNFSFNTTSQTVTVSQGTGITRALSTQTLYNRFNAASLTGTITHAAGLLIAGFFNDSTNNININNVYGLLINPLNEGSSPLTFTNRWGIYQEGTTDNNYFAANVNIGSNTINSSAILNVTSTTQGFLPPRMTATQKTAIGTPASGLIVYDTTNTVLSFYDGSNWINLGGAGSGITSLNGLTGATQTFATATTGTDFTITSAGTVHTFAIPDASTTARGLVTTGGQTFAGDKIIRGSTTTSAASALIIQDNAAGVIAQFRNDDYISFGSATIDTSAIVNINSTTAGFLMPRMTATQKTAIGTPASGLMVYDTTNTAPSYYDGTNWINLGAGGGGGITSLNGLTGATQTFATGTAGTDFAISSTGTTHTFNIPSASLTARGLVTTGTQSFNGDKTIQGSTANNAAFALTLNNSAGNTIAQFRNDRLVFINQINPISGTLTIQVPPQSAPGLNITTSNTYVSGSLGMNLAFAPTASSGSGDITGLRINGAVNNTSTSTSVARAIYITNTITSITGTYIGIHSQVPSNANALCARFSNATLNILDISSQGTITVGDAVNFALNTTTGSKIGTSSTQKIGFWNVSPVAQPTTAIGSATFASPGAGSTVKTDDTFDGYTLQQVVKALRDIGILA